MNSKARYKQVVETVRQNTGGSQLPLASERAIRSICCSTGPLEVDEYQRALQAAIENDDLLEWHGQLAVAEPDGLRAVIDGEADSETARKRLVANCNRLLENVDKKGGESP
jgi:hypothetical protein